VAKFSVLLLLGFAVALSACTGGGGGNSGSKPNTVYENPEYPELPGEENPESNTRRPTPREEGPANQKEDLATLEREDLAVMLQTDSNMLRSYDVTHNKLFTKMFGGTTGADMLRYFRTRIKYSITEAQFKKMEVVSAEPEAGVRAANLGAFDLFGLMSDNSDEAKVIASNIGTALWYYAKAHRVNLVVRLEGQPIAIDTSRVGIMMFGEGYTKYVEREDGSKGEIIPEFRIMTLLHEARHSDCTGGITRADLDTYVRTSKNKAAYEAEFKRNSCGHFHVYCPAEHEYAGLPACDRHAWGAYSVSAVYFEAILPTFKDNYTMYAKARAHLMNLKNRLTIDFDNMVAKSEPNMSSSGLLQE
jgi:hypothetical protein